MNFLIYIESIDKSVFLNINQNIINPFFDIFFPSLRELTYVFWILLIIYFFIRKERKLALLMVIGISAGAAFIYPVKYFIDRARPYDQIESTRLLTSPESDPSFPSGHAELSFLTSTVVSKFHPEYSKYLYTFSSLIALSRVYVGVHFPMDIVGGVIIGIIIGRLILVLEQRKGYIWKEKI
ncbi:MAG: phosphatase PAP2 family protein [Candidatus Methanoperedens sp.]|nr:phosphatase PAP2 family protein [Candidatus Methanoperedens nitroreducens]MDJ1422801.1 phosphatase PAP2 family protein [Candidatus Methanoperedens sp.]